MTALGKEKFKSMKRHFDGVLDPYNFTTLAKNRTAIDYLEKAVKWYQDSSVRYAHALMGPLKGKNVLDVGCGTGIHLVWLAKNGANVTGIDVSDKRIEMARKVVKNQGLEERVSLYPKGAEDTGLPGESFDIVYGQDILMFLDGRFDLFISEARRILKKGASLIFSEALDGHPIARCYRKYMAPAEWKEFTHYFNLKYIADFKKAFDYVDYKTFYLTGFAIYALKMYVPFYKLFSLMDSAFGSIDSTLIKCFPNLEKYCWRVVFEARK